MSVKRMVFILATALAVTLSVVILRAEATRLESELSRFDGRADVLRLELREQELELSRLRSPARIRARVAEMRLQDGADERSAADSPTP